MTNRGEPGAPEATTTRLAWHHLPDAVRAAVIDACGPVRHAKPHPNGSLIFLRTEAEQRVCLKAARVGTAAGLAVRREQRTRALRDDLPAPGLVLAGTIDDWYVTVLRHVSGSNARLHPDSAHLEPVLAALAGLAPRLTTGSVPDDAVLAEADLSRVVDDAWSILDSHTPHLAREERGLLERALHGFEMDAAAGTTLLNGNLDPRNILLTPGGVHLLDWGRAAYGAAWLDAVPFGLHLIHDGHAPGQAETLLADSFGSWRAAPHKAVTGLIAAWTADHIFRAVRHPQQQGAAVLVPAGLLWLRHRTRPD
uniref:hypothetical protein n=1 Tax=Nonomuraea sp. CA-252377 TaxID=3240003 RepID=UPI003F49A2B2